MKTIDFYKGSNEEIVVALGFFDSIHVGHKAIINRAKDVSKTLNCNYAVFTFTNDVDSVLDCSNGLVLTYQERIEKLEKLSVNTVISTNFTKEFSQVDALKFFNTLITNFKVKAIVCGKDYRFGRNGVGDVNLLSELCKNIGIELHVVDDVTSNGIRVSTTDIKHLLLRGEIELANQLLGECYSITGEVVHGREVGRVMGFPTANVVIDSNKVKIKMGVYKTHVILNGKVYNGITNYGSRPTFDLNDVLTETYLDGYQGDLYGKVITVYFDKFIRKCIKFNNIEELTLQLQSDLREIQ